MIKIFVAINFSFYSFISFAQFTHADTLRGSNGPGRDWWDVLHYNIEITPDYANKSITGYCEITFNVDSKKLNTYGNPKLQIDLQSPLIITRIEHIHTGLLSKTRQNEKAIKIYETLVDTLSYTISGNACFINIDKYSFTSKQEAIRIYYQGKPVIAKNPPWNGGLTWATDKNNNPWVTLTSEGIGASIWFPCKDYLGDEPEYGSVLTVTIPDTLACISNGRLKSRKKNPDKTETWSWQVKNPINNYNIVPYIGNYVNFNEVYKGEKGNLEMNYWVLDYNLQEAKRQFKDATRMMKAFEHWFGPYPFYEDGYKLVESPHLGMEHQSAIAYGNNFGNGYYRAGDLSGTGWGLKWDYIIVHESGHEWFGNNITVKDIADMWIHEGFTTYSETLFTEFYYGKKAGSEYVIGQRKRIRNTKIITGIYGVNKEGSGDMYYKGSNMIHTVRQIINDDEKFRLMLRGLNKTFYHQTITGRQVENYISKYSGMNLSLVFEQYLRTTMIPVLEYKIEKGTLTYRWKNVVKGFNMPVKVMFQNDNYRFIYPTETFKEIKYPATNLKVDDNFYVNTASL